MKKLLLILLLLSPLKGYADAIIERTGLYGLYVKNINVSFWKFWEYNTIYKTIGDHVNMEPKMVRYYLNNNLPVLTTFDYENAVDLQDVLQELHCITELKEIQFIAKNEENADCISQKLNTFLNKN